MDVKRVLILGDSKKPHLREAVDQLLANLPKSVELVGNDLVAWVDGASVEADLALVFGGDGAMLAAARRLAGRAIPVLGVNVGHFGFLTELTPPDLPGYLGRIFSGDVEVASLLMLECLARRGDTEILRSLGVNDAVVSRGALSRLIALKLRVNGEEVTTYRGDGLIVSTPIGSTAHSLAAGGPLVDPELDAFVLTPICPHTLSNRPLVMPGQVELEIEVLTGNLDVALTVDGQECIPLQLGDHVVIRRAAEVFRLVRVGMRTYFETLRDKLRWGGSH